ncbi:hypothetical protein Bsub01_03317 [Bacillus subtilis]
MDIREKIEGPTGLLFFYETSQIKFCCVSLGGRVLREGGESWKYVSIF